MEDVSWSGGAAAQAPGEGWPEHSNTLPCCERGRESFRSTGEQQSLTIFCLFQSR